MDAANSRVRELLGSGGTLTDAERGRLVLVDASPPFLVRADIPPSADKPAITRTDDAPHSQEAGGARVKASLMPDGLHPNAAGMREWARALRPFLEGAFDAR